MCSAVGKVAWVCDWLEMGAGHEEARGNSCSATTRLVVVVVAVVAVVAVLLVLGVLGVYGSVDLVKEGEKERLESNGRAGTVELELQ